MSRRDGGNSYRILEECFKLLEKGSPNRDEQFLFEVVRAITDYLGKIDACMEEEVYQIFPGGVGGLGLELEAQKHVREILFLLHRAKPSARKMILLRYLRQLVTLACESQKKVCEYEKSAG